jgi:putative ABC transport system permease protein
MKPLRRLWARFRGLSLQDSRESEIEREFQSHLEMHIDDNIRSGMSPEEARRQALLKFGGMESVKESLRQESRLVWLETLWQDIRYSWRGLRLNRGFAATAILSLALGIGASVAIFTVADNLLLRPLPYPDASRLVMIYEANQRLDVNHNTVSPANYFDWKAQSSAFSAIGGFVDRHVTFGDGKRAEQIDAQAVSSEVLPLLGAHTVRGRLFTSQEDTKDAKSNGRLFTSQTAEDNVAIISYRLWQSWFGGDESVIGRQVQVNARPFTIVGVLSPDFYFHRKACDVWVPLGLKPAADLRTTQGRWMWTIARIKPEISLGQARAEMGEIARRLEVAYPDFNKGWGVNVEPLRDSLVSQVRTSVLLLLGAVFLLLTVACANVAHLLLARHTARMRELAVRGALGASPLRLVRQLLTESVVLGAAAGILGILLAWFGVDRLIVLAPKELTRSVQVTFDLRIVLFAVALAFLTSILFGIVPALLASRRSPEHALHAEGRSNTGAGNRLRSWLVVGEIACSVALLAGAGLLFRTLIGLQEVNPGLDAHNVLTFRVNLPKARYSNDGKIIGFFREASAQLAHLPGVRSASAISFLPFNGLSAGTDITIAGRPPARPGEGAGAVIRTVLPNYFRTMGIPVKEGRDFTPADDVADSPYRFIVNEAFVRKYFRDEPPLGHQISALMDKENPFGEIIGVTGDVKEGSVDQDPEPTVYYIHSHLPYGEMVFVVRTEQDPMQIALSAQRVIQSLDPELPVAEVKTMESVVRSTYARQQFSTVLLSGFSLSALLLAAIGLYGLLSYSVIRRTREIGVRVALGAEPQSILRLVVGSGVRLVAVGAIVGLAAALLLAGLMKSMLYGVSARDPLTFLVAPVLLLLVSLVAAYFPARRAAHVSPCEALRAE